MLRVNPPGVGLRRLLYLLCRPSLAKMDTAHGQTRPRILAHFHQPPALYRVRARGIWKCPLRPRSQWVHADSRGSTRPARRLKSSRLNVTMRMTISLKMQIYGACPSRPDLPLNDPHLHPCAGARHKHILALQRAAQHHGEEHLLTHYPHLQDRLQP